MEYKSDDESLKTRIIGLVLLCFGMLLFFADYYMRENSGTYYPLMTFSAPLLIAIAIICIVETPKIPIEKPGVFGWFCIGIGSIVGIWNAVF